jgi:hypothetical protein
LPISGTDKAVLGCLVDFANSQTGACWPAQETIAKAIGKDIRAVQRSIHNLIKTPFLKRTRRSHTSNLYEIGWDALLQAFDAYKERRSRNSRNGKALMPPGIWTDKNVGSTGTKASDQRTTKMSANKEQRDKEQEKRNTLKASPRGDGACAPLILPTGEVKNVGGLLAMFERAFKRDPNSIPNLDKWHSWLFELHTNGDRDDPNVQRAVRLEQDVYEYLGSDHGVSPEFEEWYSAYPLHVGRVAAMKAYKAARKKTDQRTLLIGAKRAAKQYADSDDRFIPHPATWLNQERWLDEEPFPAKTREQKAEDALYALVR